MHFNLYFYLLSSYLYSGNGLKPISVYPGPLVLVALVKIFGGSLSFFGEGILRLDIAITVNKILT